jgi:hypothetical protein
VTFAPSAYPLVGGHPGDERDPERRTGWRGTGWGRTGFAHLGSRITTGMTRSVQVW